jgi:nucleotide-binding universal stress UspA family protein
VNSEEDYYNGVMYKTILSAVNESTNSEITARYAIALAKSCKASLSLVFVAEDKLERPAFRQAESAIERLFIEAEKHHVEVKSIIDKGDPLKKIRDIVTQNSIELAFTSTRREDVSKRFFVRTRAREFMLKLPCSVAMVRIVHMGKIHPRNILVPLRGHMTHHEERACFVAKLAETFNAQVTLFHQHSPITSFFRGEVPLKPPDREDHMPKDIEEFIGCLKRYHIAHERRSGYGTLSGAITIEAAHRQHDLIVMGASERSLLRSIMSGNPVEEVLRETPCNLIILRPRHKPK